MKKRLISGLVLLPLVALAACNTVEGVGKDLGSLGSEMSKSADRNK